MHPLPCVGLHVCMDKREATWNPAPVPVPAQPRPRWRRAVNLLLGMVGLGVTFSGAWWTVADLVVDHQSLDGLGVVLGIFAMAVGLPILVGAVAAWTGRRMPTLVLWACLAVVVALQVLLLIG